MIQDIDNINVSIQDDNNVNVTVENDSINVSEGTPTDIAEIMHNEEIRQENEAQRILNENQRILNEEDREEYIADLKQKVLDGDFDGYSPTATVVKENTTATITITDKNGTTTASISDGTDGIDGTDGVSPVVSMEKQGKVTTLTITDATGTHTTEIIDGNDGSGTGDMLKATYDTNDNGVVDNAEKVNNHTVETDVPADAVFTDTTYTAGTGIDITGTVISNTQTSFTPEYTFLNGRSVSPSINPVVLDEMEAGTYMIDLIYTSSTDFCYFKLSSEIQNTFSQYTEKNFVIIIPKKIDVSTLSNNDTLAIIKNYAGAGSVDKTAGEAYIYLYYDDTQSSKINSVIKKVYLKNVVTTAYTQTITGKKTFDTLPESSVTPTTNYQLTNKSYVDTGLSGKQATIDSSHKLSADLVDDTSTTNKFFSGNYNDLSNKPTIPTNTSDLNNDSNFISTSSTTGLIKNDGTIDTTSYSTFSGSYNDLSNKPTIPDELADLSDDSTHRVVTDTEKTTWSGKQDALVSGTNIKTINNTSLLGSGDIEVGADIPQQDTAPSNPQEDDLWIDTDDSGYQLVVDSTVSTTSTNPIENQAITNFVKGVELYYNVNGTTGTVNLSDSVANYDYIEIFFKQSEYTNVYSSVKLYKPNNTQVCLTSIQADNNGVGIYTAYCVVNGTTITKSNYGIYWTNGGYNHTDKIYITRVVGYK